MHRISALWSPRAQKRSSAISAQSVDPATRRHVKEDYWPANLEKETEKAARILHSFCSTFSPVLFFLWGFFLYSAQTSFIIRILLRLETEL